MSFRFLYSRQFLSVLALVATGVFVGNLVGNGGQWRAQVGTCGNGQCSASEKGFVRSLLTSGLSVGAEGLVDIGTFGGGSVGVIAGIRGNPAGIVFNHIQDGIPVGGATANSGPFGVSVSSPITLSIPSPPALADLGDLGGDGTKAFAVTALGIGNVPAVSILFVDQAGTAQRANLITLASAGISSPGQIRNFARSLANAGDIDGDGIQELAVGGARLQQDGYTEAGSVWIFFMNRDGTVKSSVEIGSGVGGLQGTFNPLVTIVPLGNFFGDGKKTIAVGDTGNGNPPPHEGLRILSFNTNGTIARQVRTDLYDPALPAYRPSTYAYGHMLGLANIGDWNGDGVTDLAIGTGNDNNANGSVWITTMNADGTIRSAERVGNGSTAFGVDAVVGNFGEIMTSVGDLDGDGKRDLVVLEHGNSANCPTNGARGIPYWVLYSSRKNGCPADCSWCPSVTAVSSVSSSAPSADLFVGSLPNTQISPGQTTVQYTISARNNGPSAASSVVISIYLPVGYRLDVGRSDSNCEEVSGSALPQVRCTRASAASGDSWNTNVYFVLPNPPPTCAVLQTTVAIGTVVGSGSPSDPDLSNNQKTFTSTVWCASSSSSSSAASTPAGDMTWTAITDLKTRITMLDGIAYGNGLFVTGGVQGKGFYSQDGITWTAIGDTKFNDPLLDTIRSITFGNGKFVAVGYSGKGSYSFDGITWTAISDMKFIKTYEGNILSVTYGNGKFVAVGAGGEGSTSTDGVTWTAIGDMKFGSSTPNDIYSVTYGAGKFVAVGDNSRGSYSLDGVTWTAVGDMKTSGSRLNSVTYGNGLFVAGGATKGAYSTDGVTWTAIEDTTFGSASFISPSIQALCFGNGRFVATATFGKGAYSFDGITWTAIDDMKFGKNWVSGASAIAYGNGKFVAVGMSGEASYSGPSGAASSSTASSVPMSSTCGNGQFASDKQCDNPGMLQTLTTGQRPGWVVHGDFSGDGREDLASMNYGANDSNSISVFINRGDGTFLPKTDYSLTQGQQVLALDAMDANGDGKMDLIVKIGGKLRILKGNGDGTFQAAASLLSGDPFIDADGFSIGDFNEDGRTDIVVSTYSGMNPAVLQFFAGQAGGGYATAVTVSGYPHPWHKIIMADFDADGHLDVAYNPAGSSNDPAGSTFNGSVQVLYGNGAGAFTSVPIPIPSMATSNMAGIFIRDFNADGRPDILVDGNGSVSTIWLNNGNRTFQEKTFNGGVLDAAVAYYDYDGDGKTDAVTYPLSTGYPADTLEVHRGVGDGTFSPTANPVIALHTTQFCVGGIATADFNDDGKLDMALPQGNACNDATTNRDEVVVFLSPCSPGQTCNSSCQCTGVASSRSSSASSISYPPAACANGIIEPGEQCEIGYSCVAGATCAFDCRCTGGVSSSSQASSGISVASSSQQSSAVSSTASSASAASSVPSVLCGNGVKEGSEQCEANQPCPTGQYCSNCQCMTPNFCGDQVVNSANGEECESDSDCPEGNFCTLNCLCHADTGGNCGNGNLEAQEQCERNHPCSDGKQCQTCVCIDAPRCGNSALERGEQCEVNDACPAGSSCVNCLCQQSPGCGNGILGAGEQCEQDSHCATGQYCNRLSCRCEGGSTESCGNGVLDGQEQCELGQPCQNADEICDLTNCSCVLNVVTTLCGNAQVDAGEDCDIGTSCGDGEICNFAGCHCIPWEQRCGDAELSPGEECEIGSPCADPTKACDMSQCTCAALSQDEVCGNGLVEVGEECEVGTACPFGWSCDFPHCRCLNQPVCGDATLNPGEQCEINSACSGANQTCDFSRCRCVGNIIGCGNGVIDPGEQCDDGNKTDGDGCSMICQREWQTMVGGTETCGNGIVELGEECDDGNRTDNDGCSARCQWEMSGATPGLENPTWGIGDHAAGSQVEGGFLMQGGYTSDGVLIPGSVQGPGGTQAQGSNRGAQTIVFPGQQGWNPAGGQQQQQQIFTPSYYGSAVPYAPAGGPVGSTGPAAVAVIAAGAAGGWAWARRKRRQ